MVPKVKNQTPQGWGTPTAAPSKDKGFAARRPIQKERESERTGATLCFSFADDSAKSAQARVPVLLVPNLNWWSKMSH